MGRENCISLNKIIDKKEGVPGCEPRPCHDHPLINLVFFSEWESFELYKL